MNVIVGRRPNASGSGFSLDKFSLYYPDNSAVPPEWGNTWDLLQGYSFRTAVLNGSLNRGDLAGLRHGRIRAAAGTTFDRAAHGLVRSGSAAASSGAWAVEGEATQPPAHSWRAAPPVHWRAADAADAGRPSSAVTIGPLEIKTFELTVG